MFGLDGRSYLVASIAGRGGRYLLEAGLVFAIGTAVRTLTEMELYAVVGVVTALLVLAYLLREWWMSERLRPRTE